MSLPEVIRKSVKVTLNPDSQTVTYLWSIIISKNSWAY